VSAIWLLNTLIHVFTNYLLTQNAKFLKITILDVR